MVIFKITSYIVTKYRTNLIFSGCSHSSLSWRYIVGVCGVWGDGEGVRRMEGELVDFTTDLLLPPGVLGVATGVLGVATGVPRVLGVVNGLSLRCYNDTT